MCCVTRSDRFRSEYITGCLGIADITGKMIEEYRLRCFGLVERRDNDEIVKKMGEIKVEGNRISG